MHKRTILALMGLCCVFATSGTAADMETQVSDSLTWIITGKQDGQYIDKEQAARIYDSACQWIAHRFEDDKLIIRPHLTVHVGERCPNSEMAAGCISPAGRDLYLPKWDQTAPGAIAQATLSTALLELIGRPEMEAVTRSLVVNDNKDFVSARALTKPSQNSFASSGSAASAAEPNLPSSKMSLRGQGGEK